MADALDKYYNANESFRMAAGLCDGRLGKWGKGKTENSRRLKHEIGGLELAMKGRLEKIVIRWLEGLKCFDPVVGACLLIANSRGSGDFHISVLPCFVKRGFDLLCFVDFFLKG